ncbi:MAG TPA: hypothetical protein PLU50_10975, partial [Pseudobdellovibrionaceae bacterium]|nr:hypothetical protein [Pseudobdellovibrionaceae bacterium]
MMGAKDRGYQNKFSKVKIAISIYVSVSAFVKFSHAADQISASRTKTTVVKAQVRKPSVKANAIDNQELTLDSEVNAL